MHIANFVSGVRLLEQRFKFGDRSLFGPTVDQHDHVDLSHNPLLVTMPSPRLRDNDVVDEKRRVRTGILKARDHGLENRHDMSVGPVVCALPDEECRGVHLRLRLEETVLHKRDAIADLVGELRFALSEHVGVGVLYDEIEVGEHLFKALNLEICDTGFMRWAKDSLLQP